MALRQLKGLNQSYNFARELTLIPGEPSTDASPANGLKMNNSAETLKQLPGGHSSYSIIEIEMNDSSVLLGTNPSDKSSNNLSIYNTNSRKVHFIETMEQKLRERREMEKQRQKKKENSTEKTDKESCLRSQKARKQGVVTSQIMPGHDLPLKPVNLLAAKPVCVRDFYILSKNGSRYHGNPFYYSLDDSCLIEDYKERSSPSKKELSKSKDLEEEDQEDQISLSAEFDDIQIADLFNNIQPKRKLMSVEVTGNENYRQKLVSYHIV